MFLHVCALFLTTWSNNNSIYRVFACVVAVFLRAGAVNSGVFKAGKAAGAAKHMFLHVCALFLTTWSNDNGIYCVFASVVAVFCGPEQ